MKLILSILLFALTAGMAIKTVLMLKAGGSSVLTQIIWVSVSAGCFLLLWLVLKEGQP